MSIAVAIAGTQDIDALNAAELLDDYLGEGKEIYVPSYINGPGLKKVLSWLNDVGEEYNRVKKADLVSAIDKCDQRSLVILGTEGSEDLIAEAHSKGIEVLDLTRAMWDVPLDPPDGSVSHAEPLSDPDLDSGMGSEPAESTEPPDFNSAWNEAGLNETQLKQVKEMIMTILHSEHEHWHTQPAEKSVKVCIGCAQEQGNDHLEWCPVVTGRLSSLDNKDKTKYYKSKTGKFRPAGRSKPRPGETEVFLTQEEIDNLE